MNKISLDEAYRLHAEMAASYEKHLKTYERLRGEAYPVDVAAKIRESKSPEDCAQIRELLRLREIEDSQLNETRALLLEKLKLIGELGLQILIMEKHLPTTVGESNLRESSIGRCDSCDHYRPVPPMNAPWRGADGERLDSDRSVCALTGHRPQPDEGGCRSYKLTIKVDAKI